MTKQIELTQGQVALVDDWRYDELNQFKWCARFDSYTNSFYAVRGFKASDGKWTTIRMHRVVANTPKGMKTDHKNRNTLDNQEENVRICNNYQNSHNRIKQRNNKSGYKGVFWFKNKWVAEIASECKSKMLGSFSTPEEAARAYDEAAKRLHGEFANLNFRT